MLGDKTEFYCWFQPRRHFVLKICTILHESASASFVSLAAEGRQLEAAAGDTRVAHRRRLPLLPRAVPHEGPGRDQGQAQQ